MVVRAFHPLPRAGEGWGEGETQDGTQAVPYSKPPSVIPARLSSTFVIGDLAGIQCRSPRKRRKSKDTGSSINNVEDDRRRHGDAVHGRRHRGHPV